jgi:hypothetical protein
MKAEEQTKLNETLSKVFKLDTEQLATLYNDAGDLTDLAVVIEADTKRVAKFSSEKTAQYNRGIKEGAGKIEKELKEKYEVESDLIGVELVDLVVTKQLETASKDKKDITKHPDYIKLETSIDKKLKDRDKDWEGKIEVLKSDFNKAKFFEKIRDKALANLESRKPILPSDPAKAQVWKDTYLNELRQGNYQESEDGEPIVLDKEGNALKDKHGNPVTFAEYEKSISDKYFEYPVAEKRDSPGNKTIPGQQGPIPGDPKTKADCLLKLKDPKITPEDRKKFTDLMDNLKE